MVKIIAGNRSKKLAYDLSINLNVDYVDAQVKRFPNQEFQIHLQENLKNEDVIIVQSTANSANDNLMELMLLTDAAKNAGANKITALIPYLNYSRQNKASYDLSPASARLAAKLFEASGINNLVVLDLHSEEIKKFFKITVQNIDPIPIFINEIKNLQNFTIVSPDSGGHFKAKRLAQNLKAELAIINKSRDAHNICHMKSLEGNVRGKNCLLIDDIIDTGETLCKATALLKQNGALDIYAFVTHSILSGTALHKLETAPISRILTTNSIIHEALPLKFTILDITEYIAAEYQSSLL